MRVGVSIALIATLWLGTLRSACAAPAPVRVPQGFEVPELSALKGWEIIASDPSSITLDRSVFHSGKTSLRVLLGGGTTNVGSMAGVRTASIPYRGQLIKVSAWMKTRDVVVGTRPWLKAAIQVVSYDSKGTNIGHRDIALTDGTTDWKQYRGEFRLSRTVSNVRLICHLWGDSKGTVWFDDVDFRLEDDELSLAPRIVNLEKATVTVDLSKTLGEFRHLWAGTDATYTDRVASESGIAAMRQVRRMGFRYVRLHECIFNTRVYSEDSQGRPHYNWKMLDDGIGAVVDNGMLPVVVLETMPAELAGDSIGKSWTNPLPPKDGNAYLKWQELAYQLVKHCKEKWGDGIHDWYFEVWNEPDASHYFRGTREQYLKIYDHAVAGATRADPKITIGGVGGAGTGWTEAFLEHCAQGQNDATGQIGARTDYFSWHIYTVGTGIPDFDNLKVSLNTVKSAVKKFPRYSKLPLLITEWGCSSDLFRPHDRPYDAAFRTMAVRTFMDYGVTLALPFCLAETPHGKMQGFRGDLSMYTQTTIPKPNARAFELLARMRGNRVNCVSSNDPVGGLACISKDGGEVRVMLYNLVEDYKRPAYTTRVTLRVNGLPKGKWNCAVTSIVPNGCDPYAKWLELGSPNPLSKEQQDALMAASQLPAPREVQMKGNKVDIDVPGFSVALVELRKQN
jgi:xylan 1,4-beta-xylosidase